MSKAPNTSEDRLQALASRLRSVCVGLREELVVSRHVRQGEASYVVHDPISFQNHHITAEDYQILVALDPDRSLGEVFASLVECQTLDEERAEDFYNFVLHLNQLGLLNLPISDGNNLYQRRERKRAAQRKGRLWQLLFLRVPLCNPDAFLARTMPLFAWLFTRAAFCLWLLAVIGGGLLLFSRWEEFCNPLASALALENLPMLWLLLVGLKVAHEFGHAYACKRFGGHVPEMGAYFILFTPCAYVDASDSWSFSSRRQRIVVSMAGMYFESMIGLTALLCWSLMDDSPLREIAHYTVLLSSIVTIGFNINPLTRYDGYFVLCDLVDVPNLRQLASRQVRNVAKRVLFGVRSEAVAGTLWNRFWLTVYGLLSEAYKAMLMVVISAVLAIKIPLIGVWLAILMVGGGLAKAGLGVVKYIALSPETQPVRWRAAGVCGLVVAAAIAIVGWMPAPGAVRAVGVVGRSEDRIVRAEGSGFLAERVGTPQAGDPVTTNTVLARLENPDVQTQLAQTEAELRRLSVAYRAGESPASQAAAEDGLRQLQRRRDRLAAARDELTVTAPLAGELLHDETLTDAGRYVARGDVLAEVSAGEWVVRAYVAEQNVISAAPRVGDEVRLRVPGAANREVRGRIERITPQGSRHIDAMSLARHAGGTISTDPMQDARHPHFELTIRIASAEGFPLRNGMTAHILLYGGRVTLGRALYRRMLHFVNELRFPSE